VVSRTGEGSTKVSMPSNPVGLAWVITSRVATEAAPHQILATAAAREEIGLLDGVTLAPLGRRQLKVLAEGVEVFELRFDAPVHHERVRDPVCGMEMIPSQVTARLLVDGRELAFCCERCLRLFLDAPHKHGG
jgi:YHS domain-containing protein